jgi:hypothetical protein
MDFFTVCTKEGRGGVTEVYPDFIVGHSKDLMVRGQSFYAIWDEDEGMWSTKEYDVQRMVDSAVLAFAEDLKSKGVACTVKLLRSNGTNIWNQYKRYLKNASDNAVQLDSKLTFANTEVKKKDYVSRRLPYSLGPGDHSAWDELLSVLYSEEERAKIEWAIGSIVAGASQKIEKFLVFYGPGGTGKSTILKIVQRLFEGYVAMFEAKALVGSNNSFSTEAFKSNPLVAIQHDGDLSKIEDNSKLNSVISHEPMFVNEKYKPQYEMSVNAMVFMGTNKPVKITDAKSGLIRRLIDVVPTGNKLEPDHYYALMERINFELGAIAQHCLEVYKGMGKNAYNEYRPESMMNNTDVFYNFVMEYFDLFKAQDSTTLKQAWELYKAYQVEAAIDWKLTMIKFREALKDYFAEFHDRKMVEGAWVRSYYSGFTLQPFRTPVKPKKAATLVLDKTESLLDELLAGMPAQEANAKGFPKKKWEDNPLVLRDLDTSQLHYVQVPENLIVIDFDIRGADGEKNLELNMKAASKWPPTYAELSQGGNGVHLHYTTDLDVKEIAAEYSEGIEIKTLLGNAGLRRRLTKCNAVPIASINSGLPFKEKKMHTADTLQSERGLRELIGRNLRKEINAGTKPSIDFIKKILDDAYEQGLAYDVTDMRPRIIAFANNSTNNAGYCLKVVAQMKWAAEAEATVPATFKPKEDRIVIFDVEVYRNLFVICWKFRGTDDVVVMINPSAADVEALFQFKLVGFNNRRYDNHILWAAMMGFTNEELYNLSQAIISGNRNAMFGEAYNLSYADIYDFSSIKQGLKKFMIQLGLHHMEMEIPWDQPVPPEMWPLVVEYCKNDVLGTEAVFDDRKQDFVARQILASLSGLQVNDTTAKHTAKIIFGDDRNPQSKFIYTDLSEEFPGYTFDPYNKLQKSSYRGEDPSEGGYVYAEPGIYEDVAVLDVASMHPTSLVNLEAFGIYTPRFKQLMDARLAIKHGDYEEAKKLIGVDVTEDGAKELAYALKIVINIVYGLTSASFDNPFRDPRNKDNIVAKRGALFMIDLKNYMQSLGCRVVHIKTDSIKIANATEEDIAAVMNFGERYGYTFEHEKTYRKFCLVNDAVYIAQDEEGHWDAVGKQFQHPVVYKALFSGEAITFRDLCETKQVTQGAMYIDFNDAEATPATPYKGMYHVGRVGMFVPVLKSAGGGKLVRVKDDKNYAVGGTKDYHWLEAEMLKLFHLTPLDRMLFEELTQSLENTGPITDIIDMGYYEALAQDAIETIEKFGSYAELIA